MVLNLVKMILGPKKYKIYFLKKTIYWKGNFNLLKRKNEIFFLLKKLILFNFILKFYFEVLFKTKQFCCFIKKKNISIYQ